MLCCEVFDLMLTLLPSQTSLTLSASVILHRIGRVRQLLLQPSRGAKMRSTVTLSRGTFEVNISSSFPHILTSDAL